MYIYILYIYTFIYISRKFDPRALKIDPRRYFRKKKIFLGIFTFSASFSIYWFSMNVRVYPIK